MSIVKTERGETLTEFVDMVMEECNRCGITFMLPKRLQKALVNSKDTFYCPNGHGMNYCGKTEAEQLKEKLKALQKEKEQQHEDLQNKWLDALGEKHKLEKQLKRVHKGVCPCCNRTFVNLQRHMATKHPEIKGK